MLVVFAALMLGLHESLPLEVVWAGSPWSWPWRALAALVWGLRRFRWPAPAEALDRLDRTLPGRPITALADDPGDRRDRSGVSQAVWKAHLARMAERACRGARGRA